MVKGDLITIFDPKTRELCFELGKNQSPANRRQIRRLAFFCGRFADKEAKKFISTFLNSPMLLDYLSLTEDENCLPTSQRSKMRTKILHVLQEQLIGSRLPVAKRTDMYITLKPPQNTTVTQMVLARFRNDDFDLTIKPRYQYSATSGKQNMLFYLTYKHTPGVELELDLPFFDYVAQRYRGELTHSLSAYYQNRLEDFKGKLLETYAKDIRLSGDDKELHLVRIRLDRKLDDLRLHINDDRLEVN